MAVGRLALRLEDGQQVSRQDTSFILFLKTQGDAELTGSLLAVSKAWKARKESDPSSLLHPMRVTLFQAVLQEVLDRAKRAMEDAAMRKMATEMLWVTPGPQAEPVLSWTFLQWDADQSKRRLIPDRPPIPHQELCLDLTKALAVAREEQCVNRFHATRPMSNSHAAATLPMILEIGLRSKAANQLYEILSRITICSCWHLIAATFSQERPVAALSAGAADRAIFGAAMLSLRLCNPNNHCYANSLFFGFTWTALRAGAAEVTLSRPWRALLASLLSFSGLPSLWDRPEWREDISAGWEHPHQQHDLAEFAAHVFRRRPQPCLHGELVLAERTLGAPPSERHTLQNTAEPILCPSPVRDGDDVQTLLGGWLSERASQHLRVLPPVLMLQLNRFCRCDGQPGKNHSRLTHNAYIQVPAGPGPPAFCRRATYLLSAVSFHLGRGARTGHYKALLYAHDPAFTSPVVFVCDDG
jgi:hypothetical protein